jgi:hypothetical protein
MAACGGAVRIMCVSCSLSPSSQFPDTCPSNACAGPGRSPSIFTHASMLACTMPIEPLALQTSSPRLHNGNSCWQACLTANSRWSSPFWDFGAGSSTLQSIKRLPTHHACMSTVAPGVQRHSVVAPGPVSCAKPSIPAINLCHLPLPSSASGKVPVRRSFFSSHHALKCCLRIQTR